MTNLPHVGQGSLGSGASLPFASGTTARWTPLEGRVGSHFKRAGAAGLGPFVGAWRGSAASGVGSGDGVGRGKRSVKRWEVKGRRMIESGARWGAARRGRDAPSSWTFEDPRKFHERATLERGSALRPRAHHCSKQ